MFDVLLTTLRDRISGRRKFIKISKQHLQRLSPKEEDTLVKSMSMYQLDTWGLADDNC